MSTLRRPVPNASPGGGAAYASALILGVALVAATFPEWALTGGVPPGAPEGADFAAHVIGQRYFLNAAWTWPVLVAPHLLAPWGTNIAFTDSNPLAALIAKLLPGVARPVQVVTIWQALCWCLQPVCAVFALRSAGQLRLVAALCVAVMAAWQPIFLTRLWQSSLSSHFLILLMLGLYFRIVRRGAAWCWLALPLQCAALLIHPYLLFMTTALLVAAPATLLARRDPRWRGVMGAVFLIILAVGAEIAAFGYWRGQSPGGFGHYSMNLLGPIYPAGSALLPGYPADAIDATGSQGNSYLGLGFIVLLAVVLAAAPRRIAGHLARHAGLSACCLALTALALSTSIYAFHTLLFRIHTAVGPLQMLRASGRLFWPVAYAMLVGAIATMADCRAMLRLTLLPIALLQVADAEGLRARDRATLYQNKPWSFDPERMRSLVRHASAMRVVPVFGCTPGHDYLLTQPLWFAAEAGIDTNTMYVARIEHPPNCDLESQAASPPDHGELVVIQPGFLAAFARQPYAPTQCRTLGTYGICVADPAGLQDLAPLVP